ncbi:hypothetical protein L7F22_011229 [Adiantum nelumboides]|nr:hypothetical protein [Adiantum nelumboides]
MSRAGLYGSFGSRGLQALPLQRVSVETSVYDLCAEVKVTQIYLNDRATSFYDPWAYSTPCSFFGYGDDDAGVECVFVFPLDEESAVFSFTCTFDGRTLHAQIREKMQARAAYSHAVQSNMSAVLLEQQAENVFTCRVGRLRQGSTCVVTITYLTLLDQEGRFNRLSLPLSIAPKYTPPTQTPPVYNDPFWKTPVAPQLYVHHGHGCDSCLTTPIIGSRFHCTQCPDYDLCSVCYKTKSHEHAMQEITGCSSSPMSIDEPALPMESMQGKLEDLTIDISVHMPSRILTMQCTSHPQDTHIQQQGVTRATAHYCSKGQCFLSKDFSVIIEQEACFDPRILCELDVAHHTAAVSLAFIPRPFDMMAASQQQCELVFILDCSGSMMGASISCAAECMQLLLRSLPVNSVFNIIRFGTTWTSLFPSSTAYNDASLHAASQYLFGLRADLGGTEMHAPLEYALSNNVRPSHPRQIFLLTDAQVSNVDSLVDLVSKHGTNSLRVFTIGIGHCVDRSLCKRIAQAGNGKCEFVSADDSARGVMRDKIMRQLGRALQPSLTEVKVDWKMLSKGREIATDFRRMFTLEEKKASGEQVCALPLSFLQCPSVAPAIFVNSRFMLHALNVQLPDIVWEQANEDIHIQEEINISAKAPNESVMFQRSVFLLGQQLTRATVIHTLAARARIRELEELVIRETDATTKGKLEEEILALSLRYSIISSKASFVAVYDNGDVNSDALKMEGLALPSSGIIPGAWSRTYSPYSASSVHNSASFGSCLPARGIPFGSARPRVQQSHAFGSAIPTSATSVFPCSSAGGDVQFGSAIPTSATSVFPCSSAGGDVQFGSLGSNAQSPSGFSSSNSGKPLEGLVQLQSANGTWNITSVFVGILREGTSLLAITMESLRAVCVKHAVSEQVVATLAALRFLDKHCKEREHEWQLLALKSQYYLVNMANICESLQWKILEDIKLLGI